MARNAPVPEMPATAAQGVALEHGCREAHPCGGPETCLVPLRHSPRVGTSCRWRKREGQGSGLLGRCMNGPAEAFGSAGNRPGGLTVRRLRGFLAGADATEKWTSTRAEIPQTPIGATRFGGSCGAPPRAPRQPRRQCSRRGSVIRRRPPRGTFPEWQAGAAAAPAKAAVGRERPPGPWPSSGASWLPRTARPGVPQGRHDLAPREISRFREGAFPGRMAPGVAGAHPGHARIGFQACGVLGARPVTGETRTAAGGPGKARPPAGVPLPFTEGHPSPGVLVV